MESNIYIGCTELGRRWEVYFERFNALEYGACFIHPPRIRVLNKLKKGTPPGFSFFIRAWQLITHEAGSPSYRRMPKEPSGTLGNYGHFKDTDEVKAARDATLEAADQLDAQGVIFGTPASFTPTAANRANLQRFFQQIPRREGRQLVWEPTGLWSPQEVQGICADLDLIPCRDPLTDPEPAPAGQGTQAYLKVSSMGRHHPLTLSELDLLLAAMAPFQQVTCILATPAMHADAQRLKEQLDLTRAP